MFVVLVNRAPSVGAEKQWALVTPLNWDTNGIVSKETAESACKSLRDESSEIECKVQQLVDPF